MHRYGLNVIIQIISDCNHNNAHDEILLTGWRTPDPLFNVLLWLKGKLNVVISWRQNVCWVKDLAIRHECYVKIVHTLSLSLSLFLSLYLHISLIFVFSMFVWQYTMYAVANKLYTCTSTNSISTITQTTTVYQKKRGA